VDNVTHTLTGLVLARAGLGARTRGGTLALALASNLPDIDIVSGLRGTAAYLEHHRDLSHSLVGAPALALGLAAVLRACYREARFGALALCCLAGVAVHVFMDLWTSYGTRVLAPFDRTFYTWDLVFIVDPWLLLLLALTLVAVARLPQPERIAALGLGLMMSYVGARAVLHAQALDEGKARVAGERIVKAAAIPSPLDPFRWRFLADTGDAYWTGEVALRSPVSRLVRREKPKPSEALATARASSSLAHVFLGFATFPWLESSPTPDGTELTLRDLRFERPEHEGLTARILVGNDGRIRSEAFRF
jgi:inner membrane protein